MTSVVEYTPDSIIIRVRGFLDSLTRGRWGEINTIDFNRKVVEKVTIRLSKRTVVEYPLSMFKAVDFAHEPLGNHETFTVGLRFKSKYETLLLASFQGISPSGQNPEWVQRLMPTLFGGFLAHEADARSLANLLCQKLGMKLAV